MNITPVVTPYCIFLWHVALHYKGYLIVPTLEANAYSPCVFTPYGDQMVKVPSFPLDTSLEAIWSAGKLIVDSDLPRFKSDCPFELLEHLKRVTE